MQDPHVLATALADLAVASLIEEVSLTPKPGLVDRIDQGSHDDLTFSMMLESANCLHNTFYKMAMAAYDKKPSQYLREKIGEIGREGEAQMYQVTKGINTHKGAIWSLGLLTAAAAIHKEQSEDVALCFTAAEIAQYEDRFIPHQITNGIKAVRKYGVHGAKAEAQLAFPHIRKYSLPVFKKSLTQFDYETAKIHSFLALMANLDDTCLLHRGGLEGLNYAKKYAAKVFTTGKLDELETMNERFKERNLSPGGSADLLAATIYLYKINQFVSSIEDMYATVN